ncbi:cytochrome P450 [Zopfia rhizophila CBS 207.26]|uniref:Cytochrome P450 n=1 Tax=Zopfia rhizophila CBS 207.26 TaxID=1314779 RepID=A0A6A6E800_9PEZI|nr:cytochrome P450 [Zopfia rhizophila CBS 207.26]
MLQEPVQVIFLAIKNRWHGMPFGVVALIAFYRIFLIFNIYRNRPRNIPLKSTPYSFGKWFKNVEFILHAPEVILQAYGEIGNSTFAVPSLAEYQVLTCSEDDVKELCNGSEDTLSFHTAMTDRLSHKYTIWDFEYGNVDPHDSIPSRAIKERVKEGFAKKIAEGKKVGGWTSVSIFKFSKAVIEEVNAQVILGTELANNHDYTVFAGEFARQLSSFLTAIVAPAIMRFRGNMRKLAGYIGPVLERRLREEKDGVDLSKKYMDCIQWTVDSSRTAPQREINRLIARVIGILLASSHQMSMSLVYDICTLYDNPEYIEPLRKEIREALHNNSNDPFKEMHLLDSFLLEVARLNPPDALTVQRKVMKPFKLPSGAYIPAGNLVAVPMQALARNKDIYPDPDRFDGRRFFNANAKKGENGPVTKFTDVSYAYPYWGSPRKSWLQTIKQSLVHLLLNYDFKLEDEKAPRFYNWTTAIVPRFSTRLLLKKREDGGLEGLKA